MYVHSDQCPQSSMYHEHYGKWYILHRMSMNIYTDLIGHVHYAVHHEPIVVLLGLL